MTERQVAYKTRIGDILKSRYVKVEGEFAPNYILVNNGQKVSRVNIMAVAVAEPEKDNNFMQVSIDDGTGRVDIRMFENQQALSGIKAGDVLMVIGKPRQFGSQFYIVPEIVKKIKDNRWIKYRELELMLPLKTVTKAKAEKPKENRDTNFYEKIISLIRSLDEGSGADYQEVLSRAGEKNSEKIVSYLIEEGEIFEVRPGRLKVLD